MRQSRTVTVRREGHSSAVSFDLSAPERTSSERLPCRGRSPSCHPTGFVMSDVTTARENRILAQLPDHVLDQILSMGEIGPFMHRTLIQHRDQPVHSIHFPLSGMLSMVTVDDAGGAVEV